MKQMYLVLSDHAANSLENNFINRPTPSTECQVSKLQSVIVRHVIAGPCFRDPTAPEELTMQHVRAVPSVLEPQFHDEALQTLLFSQRALQTHLCVNRWTKALRPEKGQTMERQFCVYRANNIHHEVLTNLRPSCPSITKSFKTTPCNPSITKYSRFLALEVFRRWLLVDSKLPLTQFNSRSDRGQHKTKKEEVGLCGCKHLTRTVQVFSPRRDVEIE